MALRKILTNEDELLRKKSKPVERFDSSLHTLLGDMKETMRYNNGAGLSAVQIGVLRRVFITEVDGKLVEFVNPKIISQSEICKNVVEGCLSIPNKTGIVRRPVSVTIAAQDRFGKEFEFVGEGYQAQAICHEYDHLNGILYTDKVLKTRKQKEEI